jgi:predicted nucleic acid-binding protein
VILADTSVWVDHLRRSNPLLVEALEAGQILIHPFVIGELALGHLEPRASVLRDLQELAESVVASHMEILEFIDRERLHGFGIGYVDVHLLASARLTVGASLWTRDRRLHRVAEELRLTAKLPL